MSEEKEKSIGALWAKQSSKGEYFTGQLELNDEKIKIVVFKNNYKKEDKHPDWKIFLSTPKPQVQETNNSEPKDEDLPF